MVVFFVSKFYSLTKLFLLFKINRVHSKMFVVLRMVS